MKKVIDFFPMNCQQTEPMELIEAQYGIKCFATVVKVYQRIYANEGYYCDWNDDISMLLSRQIGLSCNLVSDIIHTAIKRDIFSKSMYDKHKILTSAWIQQSYFFAVKRRKEISLNPEYLLVDYTQFFKNADISQKNVNTTQKNVDISEQSTVEDSKVKNSIVKEKTTTDVVAEKSSRKAPAPDCFITFAGDNAKLLEALREFESFRKKIKAPLTERAKELLLGNLKKLSVNPDEQIEILNQSILNGWKGVFQLKKTRQPQRVQYQEQQQQTTNFADNEIHVRLEGNW